MAASLVRDGGSLLCNDTKEPVSAICPKRAEQFFFFVCPHESICPVFCIARFLYINSIHIYTKRDVLCKSVCKCHSAAVRCASALKPGMTEQGTGALSAVSLLFRMERHHPLSNAVARLGYSSKHFRLALSTSLFFVCPLCVQSLLLPGGHVCSFPVALCLLYILHETVTDVTQWKRTQRHE